MLLSNRDEGLSGESSGSSPRALLPMQWKGLQEWNKLRRANIAFKEKKHSPSGFTAAYMDLQSILGEVFSRFTFSSFLLCS